MVEAALHEVDVVANEELRPDGHVRYDRKGARHVVAVKSFGDELQLHRSSGVDKLHDYLEALAIL